ncbi:hypothetical protein ACOI1C_00275 [Bacillus sp. DJP31]|uniref:hypothetical protein n=1 Tax=Bacillus sp. DJP31 TaxID=3409789 RepID=UPI003BB631E2
MNKENHLTNEVLYISNEANLANENTDPTSGSEDTLSTYEGLARDARFRIDLNKF